MKFALVDPSFSGVSGNMLLGALVGLAGEGDELDRIVNRIEKEVKCKIDLRLKKNKDLHSSILVAPRIKGGREYDLEKTLQKLSGFLGLSGRASSFCRSVASTILNAERAVHKTKEVDLHELGSPDTLLDILGVAALVEKLGLFDVPVYSSAIKVGSGYVDTAHGRLPIPAPVTLEILRKHGAPFFVDGEGELATPTGVALLVNLVKFAPSPPSRVIASGTGSGTFKGKKSNILRILMCEATDMPKGEVSVLETSVDDVTGEVLGYTLERLYGEGALDVQIISTITKKNRPGYAIKVVCEVGAEEKMAGILMAETGTLGIRIGSSQKRFQVEREIKEVKVSLPGYKGNAKVKVAKHGKGVVNLKAEYEDAKRIARATGMPLRRVLREIEDQARARL